MVKTRNKSTQATLRQKGIDERKSEGSQFALLFPLPLFQPGGRS